MAGVILHMFQQQTATKKASSKKNVVSLSPKGCSVKKIQWLSHCSNLCSVLEHLWDTLKMPQTDGTWTGWFASLKYLTGDLKSPQCSELQFINTSTFCQCTVNHMDKSEYKQH